MNIVSGLLSVIGLGDTSRVGSADVLAADYNSDQHPEQSFHVPSTLPKRASMPDGRGRGTRTGAGVLNSKSRVLRTSNERFARVQQNDAVDPIEDDELSVPIPHGRSANSIVKHKSSFPKGPRTNTTSGEGASKAKDSEAEAIRLLGDTQRQAQGREWSDTDTEPGNSKRPDDAVDIALPGLDQMRLKNKSFTGGFKPMNTLDSPQPQSSRDNFRNCVSANPGTRSSQKPQPDDLIDHHYQSAHASKRQRVDHELSAPTKLERASNFTRTMISNNKGGLHRLQEARTVSSPREENSTSRTKSRFERNLDPARPKNFATVRSQQQVHGQTQALIEIDSDHEMDDESFTKKARMQRERNELLDSSESPPFGAAALGGSDLHSKYFSPHSKRSTPAELQTPASQRRKATSAVHGNGSSPDALHDNIHLAPQMHARTRQALHKGSASSIADVIIATTNTSSNSTFFAKSLQPKQSRSTGSREQAFPLKDLRCGKLAEYDGYIFVVDEVSKTFSINAKDSLLESAPVQAPRKLALINKACIGRDPSHKMILFLKHDKTKGAINGIQVGLWLRSRKPLSDLFFLLQRLGVECGDSEAEWIDKTYNRIRPNETVASRERAERPVVEIGSRRVLDASKALSNDANSTNLNIKAVEKRHLSTGQDSRTQTAAKGNTVTTGAERSGNPLKELMTPFMRVIRGSPEQQLLKDNLEALLRSDRPKRLTRSSNASYLDEGLPNQAKTPPPKPKFSESGGLGPKWTNALAFKIGKKREIVSYDDLPRLDEDEFLNDSLVGFFLLYLEQHLERSNPEAWKKTYFFNSYFYDRLTQTQKGKKGVNYDGVEKWTRNIDLFRREFVIVPVNENLHWYVAIICNLNYFHDLASRKLEVVENDTHQGVSSKAEEDLAESISIEELDNPAAHPQVLSDQPEAAEETRSSFQNLHLDDVDNTNGVNQIPSSPAVSGSQSKKAKSRHKSARKSLPARKYDPQQPVIITLDSLGSGRSATCSALRQYIKLEAYNKQGWDIDESIIKGMTAKDIPTQANYSDCGLYLCAYMERFVLDPRGFVRQILQRETQIWPQMESGDLRARFRELVIELHRQQEGERSPQEVPEVGHILLRAQVPEAETAADGENEAQELQLGKSMLKRKTKRISGMSMDELQQTSSPALPQDAELAELKTLSQVQNELSRTSPPIEVSDDEGPETLPSRSAGRKDYTKSYQRRQSINKVQEVPNNPRELAQRMRERRSPDKHRKEQHTTPRSAEKLLEVMNHIHAEQQEENRKKKRSGTADTDHLRGIHSYAQDDGTEEWGGIEGKMPETQEQGEKTQVEVNGNDDGEEEGSESEDMLLI